MSYPKQDSVGHRLHEESIDALEATGAKGLAALGQHWKQTRKELQLAIMNAHTAAAQGGTWNLSRFKSMAQPMLQSALRGILERFQALSTQTIKSSLNRLYSESVMRHAWILDQLTPESRNVVIPHKRDLHESAVTGVYYGAKANKEWTDKWSAWVDSYGSALMHNLALGASNNSSVSDAVSEVDATKSNTPQSTLVDAMTRLYDFAATYALTEGEKTIGAMNGSMVDEEIWKTRGDLRVCDDCSANEGETKEDADGEIPLHPNCHCYWLMVPRSYSDLLRSGDPDDQSLARDMMDEGIVPNALVIRNAQGEIAAKTIVNFKKWTSDQGFAVTAQ